MENAQTGEWSRLRISSSWAAARASRVPESAGVISVASARGLITYYLSLYFQSQAETLVF